MPVKQLSGEQLFDSIALAIGHAQTTTAVAQIENPDRVRREVLSIFSGAAGADPETSVKPADERSPATDPGRVSRFAGRTN
jgi:hypothetical protein